jgi:hypothetical protein
MATVKPLEKNSSKNNGKFREAQGVGVGTPGADAKQQEVSKS